MALQEKDKSLTKKFLGNIPVFRSFSDEHLDEVVNNFRIIHVKKGDDIVFQADEGTDLYIVLKGRVKVSLLGSDGSEFILTTFKQGDFFGEMSLIDGKSRSANVVAEEETYLSALKRAIFMKTMEQKPGIAYDLLTALVHRLRKANDMIETLAFLDVNERLVKYLVQNAQREGVRNDEGFYRVKKSTHQEIASHIGSSREAVTKALKVLSHKQSIVEKEGYFIIAPDVCMDMDTVDPL